MLTREHAIATFDFVKGLVIPDRLVKSRHLNYMGYAERIVGIYREGVGKCRHDLHAAVERVFADDPEYHPRRVGAFCKLLDDVSEYDTARRGAKKLRSRVFALGAKSHPLVRHIEGLFQKSESEIKTAIVAEFGIAWPEIAAGMYSDVIEFHRLKKFDGYPNPHSLLSRYNVAQVQTALFDALRLRIHATRDYKQILRYAKLAGLMHTITRRSDGTYMFEFDGPASVLTETRRYGVFMAKFIPGLLSCKGWTMEADIKRNPRTPTMKLLLSSKNGLSGEVPAPEEFDSSVERVFAQKWGADSRDGWTMERESEILHSGQHCFFPDFAFTHEDGRRAYVEVIGFWTPEYLAAKRRTLELFRDRRIILAVKAPLGENFSDVSFRIVEFKSVIKVAAVLEELEREVSE